MKFISFKNTRSFLCRFKEDDNGSMTIFGLFFFMASGIIGAIALDVASLYMQRTHLQTAADTAAHAAIYNLNVIGKDHDDSKLAAIALVQATLPVSKNGITIAPEEIQFGTFDESDGTFAANDSAYGAVRVQTSMSDARANPAQTFLFRLIGIDSFNIFANAAFATYTPECLTEGFIAEGIVDMQNQNFFGAGICVHSNAEVQLQTNNEFELGAIVSMPGGRDTVVVPGDRVGDVMGLTSALADDEIDLRVLSRIENVIYRYQFPNGTDLPYPNIAGDDIKLPDYITNSTIQYISGIDEIDSSTLPAGGVYYVECDKPNKGLTINSGNNAPIDVFPDADKADGKQSAQRAKNGNGNNGGGNNGNGNNGNGNSGGYDGTGGSSDDGSVDGGAADNGNGGNGGPNRNNDLPVLNEVVVITPCDVSFGQGSVVANARVISLSNGDQSFKAPNGLKLGGLDAAGCELSGAQLITRGGVRFAANLAAYDSQILSLGDVKFAATPSNSNDFRGSSIISGGKIDMASHVDVRAGCNSVVNPNQIQASFARMVR